MRILQEIGQKGKEWLKKALQPDILIILVVILTGVGSFELGRLSVLEGQGTTVPAQPAAVAATAADVNVSVSKPTSSTSATPPASVGNFVASKSGTKYYLPSCSGASRIKDENKVWFDTKADAEAAGYSPASNCSGL